MKMINAFRITAALLATMAVLWFGIGGLYVYKLSQREETWHDKAVSNSQPQTYAEWLAVRNDQPVVEWVYQSESRLIYVVRLYRDREYVSSVYRSYRSGQPARFAEGKVGVASWNRLQRIGDRMFSLSGELTSRNDKATDNVKLTIAHEGGRRITYRYKSADFERLPELLRAYDSELFVAMESWPLKPHHGYSRPAVRVDYTETDLPALLRGLNLEHEAQYPSIVARMVGIGRPSLPLLTDVLRAGNESGYLPAGRYSAVLDGLSRLGGSGDPGFEEIQSLAASPASTPGRKELRKKAQGIVDTFEIDAYLDERWAVSPELVRRLRTATLSPAEEAAMRVQFVKTRSRRDEERVLAKEKLVEMGAAILPSLLEQIRHERYARNRYNTELLEALGELGGAEAYLFAVRQHISQASACIEPLHKLGEPGLPVLLAFLESEERFARSRTAELLATPEYGKFVDRYAELLNDKLDDHTSLTSDAVQRLQQDSAKELIGVLQAHSGANRATLAVLLKAAADPEQSDSVRVAALKALSSLGSRASGVRKDLLSLVGYESGRVNRELLTTIDKIE